MKIGKIKRSKMKKKKWKKRDKRENLFYKGKTNAKGTKVKAKRVHNE